MSWAVNEAIPARESTTAPLKQLRPVIRSGATVMDRLFTSPGRRSPEYTKKPGFSGEEPDSGLL